MAEDRIRIITIDRTNNQSILGAEKTSVQVARTAIFICTRGTGTLILNGATYQISRGSMIVYFPYSIFYIQEKSSDIEGIIISCDLGTIQPLLQKVADFNSLFLIRENPHTKLNELQQKIITSYIQLTSAIVQHFEEQGISPHEFQNQPIRAIHEQQLEMLGNSLMLNVVSCYSHLSHISQSQNRKDVVLQKFISQLYQSYKTHHEVHFYAESQYLTSRYFSSIIKEKTGKSPIDWISASLLAESKRQLISTSKTVKEISDELNFPNQSYFGKWFKKLVGCSPLEFKSGRSNKDYNETEYSSFLSLELFKHKK